MKNKTFYCVRLFALLLALSLFVGTVSAAPLSEEESALISGVALQGARQTVPPVLDGLLSPSEYDRSSTLALCDGLTLTSLGGICELDPSLLPVPSFSAEETVCLTFDDTYFYVGLSVWLSSSQCLAPYEHTLFGECYYFSFSLGISPYNDLYQKTSYLTNQYYFSARDLRCIAVSGTRLRRPSDGEKQALFQLNASSEHAYADKDGVIWNSSRYQEEASFSVTEEGSGCRVTLEARVPRGDALRTLSSVNSEKACALLDGAEADYIVGLSAEASLTDQILPPDGDPPVTLTVGTPISSPCPLSDSGESWQEYLRRLDPSAAACTAVLPVAVYLAGTPPKDIAPPPSSAPDHQNGAGGSPSSPPVDLPAEIPSVTSSLSEDFLSRLPEKDDLLPENEEILYDELTVTDNSEGKESTMLGSILTFVAGVLLLLSVIGAAILFRIREKKEEKTKKSLKKDK